MLTDPALEDGLGLVRTLRHCVNARREAVDGYEQAHEVSDDDNVDDENKYDINDSNAISLPRPVSQH